MNQEEAIDPVFTQGQNAFVEGIRKGDNPYAYNSKDAYRWDAGWVGAWNRMEIKTNTFMKDFVNRPAHYTAGAIECIDAIQAAMSTEEFRGYLRGNVIKYNWRYNLKGGVEDLKKSEWYLKRLISEVEMLPAQP